MGLRNMMNNYFYGKQGQADYTVENMPQNRRQLFREVLKVRWGGLFGVNLLYMVAWIPAIIWSFLNAVSLYRVLTDSAYNAGDFYSLVFTYLLVMVPLTTITGPFNAGVTYVLRNWARDEHSFVLSDFKDALKANWKQGLAIAFIDGLMPLLVFTAWRFYGSMLANSFIYVVPIGVVLLIGFLWALSSMLAMPMLITYDLKLKDVIRNCLLMSIAKLPVAVVIKLATLAVPLLAWGLLSLIPTIEIQTLLITALLYLLFLVAFNKLITVSYANWLCETYLNPNIDGAPTDIGLRPKDWDDVVYIPEDDE